MLIFECTDCKATVQGLDAEPASEICDRLEAHTAKCPLATFRFTGTTAVSRQRADTIRAIVVEDRPRLLN